jgi:hypothetical protein
MKGYCPTKRQIKERDVATLNTFRREVARIQKLAHELQYSFGEVDPIIRAADELDDRVVDAITMVEEDWQ